MWNRVASGKVKWDGMVLGFHESDQVKSNWVQGWVGSSGVRSHGV